MISRLATSIDDSIARTRLSGSPVGPLAPEPYTDIAMADRGDHERRDEEEEEEDELGEADYKAQKDAVIFAIEVSKSMLEPPPPSDDKKADRDSAMSAALKCAYQLMQQRIISNPKDMMGVIFFNTGKTKYRDEDTGHNNLSYPHCYVYIDLNVPSADDVKALKYLVEEGEDPEEILVPSEERVVMSSLLFCANQLFLTKAPNFGSRRLFIITDNDDPHPNDKGAKNYASIRAKDLYDLGATIDVFPISRDDVKFDLAKFYNDIIFRDPAAEETSSYQVVTSKSGDGLTLLGSLVSNINSKQTPKRAYFSNMPFELGPGLQISVKGYNVIQKQAPARSCYVWLDGENAQIAVSHTARIAEDSARTVESVEVQKAYKFGGEYVLFGEAELTDIKKFGTPIVRIIGFKDRSLLKFWASLKKSIFIFPSEEGFVGSTRVFSALWQKLLRSNKVGIAWHIARRNGNPQLVAVIPSKSQSDKRSGTPFLPAGLWLYPIPTADDVREGTDVKGALRTTDELTDRMNNIITQLQLPGASYSPMKYPNPALQWHYKILQALALEEEVPEKPEDSTVPKYRSIHKRSGAAIQEWSQVADDVLERVKEEKAIKRDLEDEEEEDRPGPKRARIAVSKKGGGGMTDAELKKRDKDNTLAKLTVAELKNVMGERGLETKGLKKDLLEGLEQWIEDNL
ncbi:hypothetical protein DL762_005179 [Monosporascus cannonballus]|uniref:ATP-dependent DNA helicase II subunit 1 n=1 Tax=Monosporascus cannonballus TaxID=155416 RepID=A0ABY0H5L9_9PEZI|nr:hypothetical protein DL762_005179 [Monosporascus cannonballus]